MSSSYFLDLFIVKLMREYAHVLDPASGKGKWSFLLKTSRKKTKSVVG